MSFRELETSSGKKVVCGKDAESNEALISQFIGKGNRIFHTAKPGSPFCVIEDTKPTKKDIKEVAVLCASKSHDWRDNKSDVSVHIFTGKEIYKAKGMKPGMFGVRKFKEIKVRKKEIEKWIAKK